MKCILNVSKKFRKILILNKLTRFQFEKRRYGYKSSKELRRLLSERGSDYDRLYERDAIHSNHLKTIVDTLKEWDTEVKVIQRFEYSSDMIDWADLVVAAGGDGTFLTAAAKINDVNKPVVAVNTDPSGSLGKMCLSKYWSNNLRECFSRILQGEFKYLIRQRLRIHMTSSSKDALIPIELHDMQLSFPEYRYFDHVQEHIQLLRKKQKGRCLDASTPPFTSDRPTHILPVRALNEIFIGEALSARVSYFEIKIDDDEVTKQKSSGILFTTGTGSTSWQYNVNSLNQYSLKELLTIMQKENLLSFDDIENEEVLMRIIDKFNRNLIFEPTALKFSYTIRDMITSNLFKGIKSFGFAKKIKIRSRCFDASLVIDGSLSYPFNDGAFAMITIHPEDALTTISL
ncbi:hypothetical protein SNEBB_000057 [Seison nebaliae]|nr:hypothetical protein SNEBB_000057 [Seison nebaliae]